MKIFRLKAIVSNILIMSFTVFLGVSIAYALDYPHFDGNNIGCDSCHFIYGTEPGLLPPWTAHTPTDIDDTQSNTLCWSCHNDIEAPYVRTHSSLQIDNGYGDWTVECKVCHNPHYQKQADTHRSASYLYSGTSTDVTAATLTETGAGWTVNEYQGLVVIPNTAQMKYKYKITGNTNDTLTIDGPVNLTKAATGNTFAVVYGKLVNSTINTPNSGGRTVKFFDESGTNSFADGDSTYDGVCEICHTQTLYHQNNSTGNHSHNAGVDCITCHTHTDGFAGTGCTECHGLPPVDAGTLVFNPPGGTGSATAGAHGVHVITKGFDCSTCHFDSAGDGVSHNNSLTITMGYSLFGGIYQGGSYDGQSGVSYNTTATIPPTTVSNTGTNTCSSIYCHSTGQSVTDQNDSTPVYASPKWDDPSSAVCGTCHDVTEGSGLTSGSHGEHLVATGVNGCGDCHTGAADNASSYNSSNHVNASIDVANSYSAGGAPGNGYGTCSAASCHDDGTGNPAVTPQWGSSPAPCTACHAEVPGTGSHQKHVTTTQYNKADCGDCHDSAVQGSTPPSQHLDNNIDVYDTAAGDLGYPSDKVKGSAYAACSTAYCHSTGQSTSDGNLATPTYALPIWGNGAGAACGTCHEVTTGSLVSGSHDQHLNATGVNGCGDCHTGAADNASSYNSITHVDGFIDVDNTYSADGAPGNGYGACDTASCHDDGTGAMVTTPVWGTSPPACTACHAAAPATGSHNKHLAESGVSCADCHDNAVQGTTAPSQHLDDNIDVYDSAAGDLGYPQDKAKGSAYTNCTTASCHDDGTGALAATPDWGTTVNDCSECHAKQPATGSHTNHLTTASGHGYKRPACGDCHGDAVEGTTAPAQHRDGDLDVYDVNPGDLGYPQDEAKGGAPYTNCTTAYCHSSGQSYTDPNDATPTYASPTWGGGEFCGSCHKSETTHNFFGETIDSASHTKHLSYGFNLGGSTSLKCTVCHKWEASQAFGACNQCHGTAGANTYHANGEINVFLDTEFGPRTAYGDQTGTPGNGYFSCSNVYCHSTGQSTTDGNDATPEYTTPTWGNAASGACGTCHEVTAGSLVSGSHDQHLNATGVNGCGDCHTGAADDGSSYNDFTNHVDKFIDVANTYSAGGDPGNGYGTCSAASCHDDGTGNPAVTPTWGSTAAACTTCHAAAPATGSHTEHLNANRVCAECHKGAVQATTAPDEHLDDNIDVYETTPGDLNYTADKTKGSAYESCSNIYCHGDYNGSGLNASPTWGNSASGACGTCHGASNTAYPASGSHERHAGDAQWTGSDGTQNEREYSCIMCHKDIVSGTGPSSYAIADNTKHVNTTVDWAFDTGDSRLSGSSAYSIASGTQAPTDGTTPRSFGTCSNIYCHSNVQPDGGVGSPDVYTNPTWGTETKCFGCHTDSTTYSNPTDTNQAGIRHIAVTSGSHSKHIRYSYPGYERPTECFACHNWPGTGTGYQSSCAASTCHGNAGEKTYHVNNSVDILFGTLVGASSAYNGTPAPGDGYDTCSNVYCHSNGTRLRTGVTSYTNTTPVWGSGSVSCNSCHGNTDYPSPNDGMPNYANGSPKENSHATHVIDNSINCGRCHYNTTQDGITIASSANHVNYYSYMLSPNGSYAGSAISFSYVQPNTSNAGRCNSISCHGGNNATWGASLGCDECHLGTSDVDDYAYGTAPMAMINTTEWTYSGHGKPSAQQYNVSGNNGADFSSGVSGSGNQCFYCHDNNVNHDTATNPFRLDNNNALGNGWNDVCLVCHGTGESGFDPDGTGGTDYTLITSSVKIDKWHAGAKHGASNDGGTFCWDCHDPHGDSDGDVDDPIMMVQAYAAKNVDQYGVPEPGGLTSFVVFFNNTVGFGDNGYANNSNDGICQVCHTQTLYYKNDGTGAAHGTDVCTNCHLHNDDTTINGYAFMGSGDDCFDCHSSAGGPTAGTTPDANHAKHVQTAYVGKVSTSDYGNYSTNNWYTYSNSGGTPDMGCGFCHPQSDATHMNSNVDLNFDPADTGAAGTIKDKNNATQSYSQTEGSSVTCSSVYCHSDGYDGGSGYGYQTSPEWYGGSFTGNKCDDCHGNSPSSNAHSAHLVGIHYETIYSGTSGLLSQGGAVGSGAAHGDPNTSTTINCNICHNSTVTVSANDQNAVCNTCHSGSPQGDMIIDAGSSVHVNGTPDISFAAVTIRSKAQIRDSITTVTELNAYWQRNNGYKAAAASHDSSNATLNGTASYSTGTCSTVACHNGNTVTWNDNSVSCNSCHKGLP